MALLTESTINVFLSTSVIWTKCLAPMLLKLEHNGKKKFRRLCGLLITKMGNMRKSDDIILHKPSPNVFFKLGPIRPFFSDEWL